MARTFKLIAAGPHPQNPLNLTTTIEVHDDVTNEAIVLKDRIFGNDLGEAALKSQLGLIEQNVLIPRAVALAELLALVNTNITPTSPVAADPLQVAYQQAARVLAEKTQLVALKVIADTDKEYTDALQAVKDAKAALEAKPK